MKKLIETKKKVKPFIKSKKIKLVPLRLCRMLLGMRVDIYFVFCKTFEENKI